jgi:N-acetylglucosaminyldiphosphoundecaprenol N-acetyl-beta-D-mannosaminyltransferase
MKTELKYSPRLDVLGVPVDCVGMGQAVDRVRQLLEEPGFHLVVTLGSEMVVRAQHDEAFAQAVRKASLVVADGMGVVLAARMHRYHFPSRVAGIELVQDVSLRLGARLRVFMLGGAPGVGDVAAAALIRTAPAIQIVGVRDGYFKDDREVMDQILASGANLVLVGMGFPRQELWLQEHGPALARNGSVVGIGVGGSFDVLSGKVKRAPRWMLDLGLEWLYRFASQPTRYRRMLALPDFVRRVVLAGPRAVVARPAPPSFPANLTPEKVTP